MITLDDPAPPSVGEGGNEIPGHETILNISVMDSGIGMSADALKKVFKPFSQADTSTTRVCSPVAAKGVRTTHRRSDCPCHEDRTREVHFGRV